MNSDNKMGNVLKDFVGQLCTIIEKLVNGYRLSYNGEYLEKFLKSTLK